jgi:hypothetical protein
VAGITNSILASDAKPHFQGCLGVWLAHGLDLSVERYEFIYGEICSSDQGAQSSDGKLLVLRNGEIGSLPSLRHHYVAANLTDNFPTGTFECFNRFIPGNIG